MVNLFLVINILGVEGIYVNVWIFIVEFGNLKFIIIVIELVLINFILWRVFEINK